MSCSEARRLDNFARGILRAREFALVEKHVLECAECSAELKRLLDDERTLLHAFDDPPDLERTAAEIMRRIKGN